MLNAFVSDLMPRFLVSLLFVSLLWLFLDLLFRHKNK